MSYSIGDQVPQEVGWDIVPARVRSTGEVGEIWVTGTAEVDDGSLEHQNTD